MPQLSMESCCFTWAGNFDNTPEYTIEGQYQYEFVGNIYNAGDVNGDGKEDLAMCTVERAVPQGNNEEFSIYIFYGRDIPQPTPDWTLEVDYDPMTWCQISPLGDINHDGYDDLMLTTDPPGRYYMQSTAILGNTFQLVPFMQNHISETMAYTSMALVM